MMSDAYLKVKDNGAQGLALVREETDTSVSELKTQIYNYFSEIATFEQGTPTSPTNTKRCTTGYFECEPGYIIEITGNISGQKFALASEAGLDTGWLTENYRHVVATASNYFVNVATSDGNTNIKPEDITSLKVTVYSSRVEDLESDVHDLTTQIEPSLIRYNWYNPDEPSQFVAVDGVTKRGQTTKNADGSWTSYATNVQNGQVLYRSMDESRILPEGIYTLSARIILNENYSGTGIFAMCKIGLSSSNERVYMKTERGGDVNIAGGEKVGWVKLTVTLTEASPLVFGIEAFDQASQSLLYTVDYIQLNEGSDVLDYSTDLWRAVDHKAQSIANEALSSANTALNMAGTSIAFGNNSRVTVRGTTVKMVDSLMLFTPTGRVVLTLAQMAEMLGNAAVYDAEEPSLTITVPSNKSLVYDFDSQSVQIVNYIDHSTMQIVLFLSYYNNNSGYLWTKSYVDQIADGIYMKSALADVLLTTNGRFSIDTSARTISFSGSMYIDCRERTTISASGAAEMMPEYAVYDDTTDVVTITMPVSSYLLYSYETRSMRVTTSFPSASDVVLFKWYYGNNFGLIWDKYWRDKWIDESAKDLLTANKIFNAEPYTGAYDWQTPVVEYGKLFNGKENVEAFAFFTDPHTLGFADDSRNETRMENSFKRIQKVYNSTPCSYMVCGGDWLNNATTKDEACYRLGYLKGISKNMFNDFHLVVGNHDTNYQGKAEPDSEKYTGRLTNGTIAAIMYRDTDTKKAYYSFDGANSKCYVLDTGIEHNTMEAYDWEQVDWLAAKLASDDPEHAIIFLHILMLNQSVQTNASVFGQLVSAYNSHTTVTLNSVEYDFTACSGHVDFWVAGHTHTDSTGTLGGIPYFITASNAYTSDVPVIDLFLVDYDAGTVNAVRCDGTGTAMTRTESI